MKKITVLGAPLPNIPWEDRPKGSNEVMWRYSGNPVIPRDLLPDSNSIFNSAVVPFGKGFAGVFRCDDKKRTMGIRAGFSDDGINWRIEPELIRFATTPSPEVGTWVYGYDPRVVFIDGKYYVTWCNGYHDPTIGAALLDLEEPWKVLARSGEYLIHPREIYELAGDVPNVTFPCAALVDAPTGRIAVYYGCADTVTSLAFGRVQDIVDFVKKTNIL